MGTTPSSLDDEPRSALASYIRELEGPDFYRWYKTASSRAYYGWLINWWIAVTAGFLTTVFGVLVQAGIFEGPWAKAVVLILPALGSLTVVLIDHFTEHKALRERGRQAMQDILSDARIGYASLGKTGDSAAHTALHKELKDRVKAVEEEQLEKVLPLLKRLPLSKR